MNARWSQCHAAGDMLAPTRELTIARDAARAESVQAPIAVVLLGTGIVGGAFLKLLDTRAGARLQLVGAANSRRQQTAAPRLAERQLREQLQAEGEPRDDEALLAALDASAAPVKVVVDATASSALAASHPRWLARGYHVVTANKALAGGDASGWQALQAALPGGGAYGLSATVGAGLPVLSTLRRLRRCGDPLLSLDGVCSGSLSWLFNQHDGRRPFSALVREARRLGYTEPDPRQDLSGEDAARKLLILARTAGFDLRREQVEVTPLLPPELHGLESERALARLQTIDEPLAARHAHASSRGCVLRYLARLDGNGRARVGLVDVPATHPAARLCGTDNLFALATRRYSPQPLVIQGPGAGPQVTAQALLGDVLELG